MKSALATRGSRFLTPWTRFPLGMLRDEMDDLFTRWVGEEDGGGLARLPKVDVAETDKAIEVKADIPGYKPEDIHVELHGDMLTISGSTKEEETKEDEARTYHVVERRSGSFTRSMTLPCPVTDTAVEAKYVDGVLTVRLPKTEEAKTHKIEIKSS